jgi:hypothetical protein
MTKLTKHELMAALRVERLTQTQRLIAIKRELKALADEHEQVETRLRAIDHAEGLLTE